MGIFSWRKKTKRGADQSPEEMSFFDHLEELRWHLVRIVIAIVVFAIVLFIYRIPVIGGVFMAPFRYDFVTYRLICEHITDDFCHQLRMARVRISPPRQTPWNWKG